MYPAGILEEGLIGSRQSTSIRPTRLPPYRSCITRGKSNLCGLLIPSAMWGVLPGRSGFLSDLSVSLCSKSGVAIAYTCWASIQVGLSLPNFVLKLNLESLPNGACKRLYAQKLVMAL